MIDTSNNNSLRSRTNSSSNHEANQEHLSTPPPPPSSGNMIKRRTSSVSASSTNSPNSVAAKRLLFPSPPQSGKHVELPILNPNLAQTALVPRHRSRHQFQASYQAPQRRSSRFTLWNFCVTLSIIAAAFLFAGWYEGRKFRVEVAQLQEELFDLTSENEKLSLSLEHTKSEGQRQEVKLRKMIKEMRQNVEKANEELVAERKAREGDQSSSSDAGKQVKQAEAQTRKFKRHLRDFASAQVENDFGGRNRLYVQFTVRLPGSIKLENFVVEMAPLTFMPLTVNYFLQQVKRELWDNTVFSLNAAHVLMAQPHTILGQSKREEFLKVPGLPFREYHKSYPHRPYTLGLNGDPGGPDFYINKIDNIDSHGPDKDGNGAEPCFATVILGKEVVDKMSEIEVTGPGQENLKHPIQIVSVRHITDLSTIDGGSEFLERMPTHYKRR